MKELILLVGPPGSGKSTLAEQLCKNGYDYCNQDIQGKRHLEVFSSCISLSRNILIDRMNFSKEQRERYLNPTREAGYKTKIIVLHVPSEICRERMASRQGHPTITNEKEASSALNTFFKGYERVTDDEADIVERLGWDGDKDTVIVSDLDGTLCNTSKRQHHVRQEKKNWKAFFDEIPNDDIILPVESLLLRYNDICPIILVSARPDDRRKMTEEWLDKNNVWYSRLFMRTRNDFRQDNIIKENILDFELLPRYNILFVLDDRDQVVKMWRSRGITCFQVAEGEF